MTLAYTVRPISDRAPFRGEHENSAFTTTWSATLALLDRELTALRAEHVVFEVDVPERGIRIDGQLRADARAASPAVRVAFDSKFGPLQYSTDRFVRPSWRRGGMQQDWQHNVRAIALGLEALRQVDRYGISRRGEQYSGWKALPASSGTATAAPADGRVAIALPAAMTVDAAARTLVDLAGGLPADVGNVIHQVGVRREIYRRAPAAWPPGRGGDPTAWDQLQQAPTVLHEHAP